jgi:hypothetical protein
VEASCSPTRLLTPTFSLLPRVNHSLFLYPSVHFDFGRHFSRNQPLRVESIHNTVKMQFKNLAILAAAGTAVAEFAIITTPIPTNLGEVLTNVRSPIYASSFSNL